MIYNHSAGQVRAHDDDLNVGELDYDPDGFVAWVFVRPTHQRLGIATEMLRVMERESGVVPSHAPPGCGNSDDGDAWVESLQKTT